MSLDNNNNSSPLLESKTAVAEQKWWNKLIDVEEAKDQAFFALPMIITNVSYCFIPLVSVMFAGHLGELELAGSNLANSWATVTGHALLVGLSGALETLCGQGYGAKMYRMLGIYLQASCIVTIVFTVLISVLWWYSTFILILLHQDPQIAEAAGLYMKYLILGLLAYGFLQNILKFLQTQSVVVPLVICSLVPLALHVGITYVLVHWTTLGYRGAPLAASILLWISVIMLGLYVLKAKEFEDTWEGFSMESSVHIVSNLKLALPSAAMVFYVFLLKLYFCNFFFSYSVQNKILHFLINFPELEQAAALKYLYSWLRHHPNYENIMPLDQRENMYYADVARIFNEAAKLSPDDVDVHIVLGVLYNLSREYDKAIEAFQTALKLKPRD